MKTNNIFITGGAGFIGSHLAERLAKEGYKVILFDNLHRDSIRYTDIAKNKNIRFVRGSVLDGNLLKKEMKGSGIVLHLAAIAGVSNYYSYPALTLKTNLVGTYNVLEAVVANNIRRMVDLSTSEVYGCEAIGVNEESFLSIGPPHDKRWSYAGSKIGGEQFTHRYAEEYRFEATILRPFNIYGPRQTGEGAISNFCRNILVGKKIRLEGDGSSTRSWCFVDDFVELMLKVIQQPHGKVEAFNIGNPWTSVSNHMLAQLVIAAAKAKKIKVSENIIEFVPMNFTEIKVRYPDIAKAQKVYGWQPRVSLEEGIKKTFGWFCEHHEKS